MPLPSDDRRTELFAQASRGDATSLDELLVLYLPRLEAFVRARVGQNRVGRESCADVVQSVCRDIVGQRNAFEFRGEAEFRSWLFTTTVNKIRMKHRFHRAGRRDIELERPATDVEHAWAPRATPSHVAAAREELERVLGSIEDLSPDHREVIALARIADLPLDVVAKHMGRSMPAVRQLLARALLKLAEAVDDDPPGS